MSFGEAWYLKEFCSSGVWGQKWHRTNPSCFWLIFWTCGLWRIIGKLLSNVTSSNATVIAPKHLAGLSVVAGAGSESTCVKASFIWQGHRYFLGQVGVNRGYWSWVCLQMAALGLSLSFNKSVGDERCVMFSVLYQYLAILLICP